MLFHMNIVEKLSDKIWQIYLTFSVRNLCMPHLVVTPSPTTESRVMYTTPSHYLCIPHLVITNPVYLTQSLPSPRIRRTIEPMRRLCTRLQSLLVTIATSHIGIQLLSTWMSIMIIYVCIYDTNMFVWIAVKLYQTILIRAKCKNTQ